MPHLNFTSSDAWLFFSVCSAARAGAADLRSIIMQGDAVNHAVFTAQELRRGFAKLISADLITVEDASYRPTPQGTTLFRAAMTTSEKWPHPTDAVLAQLGGDASANLAPDFEDPRWPFPSLSDEAVDAAVAAYSAEFWAAYKKLGLPGAA